MTYTLGKKGCYTPIEDNKTNVDRAFVFPLGWNWHDMDPWLFPNEIRHYLGQTFNARSSGIVELRNHSMGGRSPKSICTLWHLWINICIFFKKFFWLFEQCPAQPLWLLGMRCLHLPVRALSKVLLLPVWVWLVLPSTTYSKGMLPLDLWCQASLQGLPERQHLGKTVHCWGWSDRIASWVLGPWRRGWEICTEWRLVAQRLTTDSCPVVTGHIDPQRSPCWLPTTVVSAWSGCRGGGTWQWPTGSMSTLCRHIGQLLLIRLRVGYLLLRRQVSVAVRPANQGVDCWSEKLKTKNGFRVASVVLINVRSSSLIKWIIITDVHFLRVV